ncbi:MAG: MBL fold metallo-hydrolase [Deltaproteobacteria bacterium]|nr:MBL fold metallo-hydrolase [Deltaproteobacteria bacterium]
MIFRPLIDAETSTYTWLLADETTREAVLIDPVIEQVDRDLSLLQELGLTLVWALDTHVHADHITALGTLRNRTGCKTALSERAGTGCPDVLLRHGSVISFGQRNLEVRETPGHTGGCISYVLDDKSMVFTGDALLIRGCGRTDFQVGDASQLYQSVHEQLFTLPDDCKVCPGHDYKGRLWSTIGEEKAHNPRLKIGRSVSDFIEIMNNLHLAYPKKIDVALPANLYCGLGGHADPVPALSADAWAPVTVSPAGVFEVPVSFVLSHPDGVRLIDVRERDEFDGPLGHLDGSELVPLATLAKAALPWDRAQPMVVVCRSGGRSAKAARTLLDLGFTRVASMAGGMSAVQSVGLTPNPAT